MESCTIWQFISCRNRVRSGRMTSPVTRAATARIGAKYMTAASARDERVRSRPFRHGTTLPQTTVVGLSVPELLLSSEFPHTTVCDHTDGSSHTRSVLPQTTALPQTTVLPHTTVFPHTTVVAQTAWFS